MTSLWRFRGGLHLAGHRRLSSESPLIEAGLPSRLILPLLRRGGVTLEPAVEVGESVARGQVIARGDGPMAPPIHASSSGIVTEVADLPLPQRAGAKGRCIVIATDGLDRTITLPPVADYRLLPPATLRTRIHQAGIVGLGGAVFPTAAKLDIRRPIDTLILNGAECEPYITCDDSLMRHRPEDVLEGAAILIHILGVERCLLGIEEDRAEAIAALDAAQRRRKVRGMRIVPVPVIYPTGGERQLTRVLTGRQVPPSGLPVDVGVVCQNVATAAAVSRAVIHGEPFTARIVTLTGRGLRTPRNLLVRIGTPAADLIARCGGYTDDAERLIAGGPMMGVAVPSDDFPITGGTSCILVAAKGELPGKRQSRPCIRCGACAEVCPEELLPQQLYWYGRSRNLGRAEDERLFDCIECGCCDIVCPSHIPLTHQFRATKSEVLAKRGERAQAEHARLRFEARQRRKDLERLRRAEEARRKKEALKTPGAAEIAAAIQRAKARKNAAHPAGDPAAAPDSETGL